MERMAICSDWSYKHVAENVPPGSAAASTIILALPLSRGSPQAGVCPHRPWCSHAHHPEAAGLLKPRRPQRPRDACISTSTWQDKARGDPGSTRSAGAGPGVGRLWWSLSYPVADVLCFLSLSSSAQWRPVLPGGSPPAGHTWLR